MFASILMGLKWLGINLCYSNEFTFSGPFLQQNHSASHIFPEWRSCDPDISPHHIILNMCNITDRYAVCGGENDNLNSKVKLAKYSVPFSWDPWQRASSTNQQLK